MNHSVLKSNPEFKNLVSVEWLLKNVDSEKLIILDATMKKKPNGELIPEPEQKILGAKIFNFDTDICDQESHLPHMMCSEAVFESAVQQLGINQDSIVVVYDAQGIFSSPRAWWMFKLMGHKNVYVLDGGLPAWLRCDGATQDHYSRSAKKGNFVSNLKAKLITVQSSVRELTKDQRSMLIDARSVARFNGTEAEPRANLNRGHIPGSICLPFTGLLEKGHYKDFEVLDRQFRQVIENYLVNISQSEQSFKNIPIIFSCGSGVTACILALSAAECGYKNISVYDGSWSEWGLLDNNYSL